MLTNCANQNCRARLYSFSEGRLFQFEVNSISFSAEDGFCSRLETSPEKQTLHLWLCGSCAAGMTLILEPLQGIKLVPAGAASASVPDGNDMKTGVQRNNC